MERLSSRKYTRRKARNRTMFEALENSYAKQILTVFGKPSGGKPKLQ
jgi:hypothetical protein